MSEKYAQDQLGGEEVEFFRDKSGFIKALYIYTRNQLRDIREAESRVAEHEQEAEKMRRAIKHHTQSVVDAKAALKLHGIDWDTISTLFKL